MTTFHLSSAQGTLWAKRLVHASSNEEMKISQRFHLTSSYTTHGLASTCVLNENTCKFKDQDQKEAPRTIRRNPLSFHTRRLLWFKSDSSWAGEASIFPIWCRIRIFEIYINQTHF